MTQPLTTIDQSDNSRGSRERRHPSIAEKIQAMGENRIGALLLLIATVVAILWANLSHETYDALWETQLTVGVGDITLDFTLHALVNDALMAIFFFTRSEEHTSEL